MTEASLLSLIAPRWRAAREKGSAPAAIGVHSEMRWQGPAEVTLDSVRVPVAQCDSVLAAREQLAVRGSNWFVLVTPLELTDLGADVEARLLRHRLLRVEPWNLLRSRFNARTFDGSLLGKAALADDAVEALGATNPDPAPAGASSNRKEARRHWQRFLVCARGSSVLRVSRGGVPPNVHCS